MVATTPDLFVIVANAKCDCRVTQSHLRHRHCLYLSSTWLVVSCGYSGLVSRYVVGWALIQTLEMDFVLTAVDFAWLIRQRRLARDYECLPETREAFIYIAMIRLMLRKLAPK